MPLRPPGFQRLFVGQRLLTSSPTNEFTNEEVYAFARQANWKNFNPITATSAIKSARNFKSCAMPNYCFTSSPASCACPEFDLRPPSPKPSPQREGSHVPRFFEN